MTGFRRGDRVRWNSEAGVVSRVVLKKLTQDVECHGRIRRCSPDPPQYEIRSDASDHIAMHRQSALEPVS